MFCFHWPFRRKQTPEQSPWEKTPTARIPRPPTERRTYLPSSDYLLPRDAEEDTRLNFQHHALFHAIGTHALAPLCEPLPLILDVGTGTGIWALEMARLFPSSLVVGVDLSTRSFHIPPPPNCLLRFGNVLTGLPFPDRFFSYTHQRLLAAGITAAHWPGVIRELVRVTREQGWIELVEANRLAEDAGPATARVQEVLETVGRSLGFDGSLIPRLGEFLRQEGLEEVETQTIPVPLGEWAGRAGSMMKRDLLAALDALKGQCVTQVGITGEEFERLVWEMAQEWEHLHPSCVFCASYGKRGEQ